MYFQNMVHTLIQVLESNFQEDILRMNSHQPWTMILQDNLSMSLLQFGNTFLEGKGSKRLKNSTTLVHTICNVALPLMPLILLDNLYTITILGYWSRC